MLGDEIALKRHCDLLHLDAAAVLADPRAHGALEREQAVVDKRPASIADSEYTDSQPKNPMHPGGKTRKYTA